VLVLILITVGLLSAAVWEIKQDGTGDFKTINEGFHMARSGDTILVYPGVYYERINFQGKNINLTSLYRENIDNREMIAETVIDGAHQGTVITLKNNETREAIINGFTIRNGSGENHWADTYTHGGGIYLKNASPVISNCIIEYNRAASGGGICARSETHPLLRGNIIRYNEAAYKGGGIFSGGSPVLPSSVEFCKDRPNSVYLNNGTDCSDLFLVGREQGNVYLDTFTVLNPDLYFLGIHKDNSPNNVEISIKKEKIVLVEADLHVSSMGDDSNSGLTPEEPLKTIAYAMTLIKPDENIRRKVYVANGYYSKSMNDQIFPIHLKSYVDLIGESKEGVILDSEFSGHHIGACYDPANFDGDYIREFSVKNFTLLNGGDSQSTSCNGAINTRCATEFEFDNIHIENCITFYTVYNSVSSGNCELSNISMYDNKAVVALVLSCEYDFDVCLKNVRIRKTVRSLYPGASSGGGVGLSIWGYSPAWPWDVRATIVNLEVSGCDKYTDPFFAKIPHGVVSFLNDGYFRLINATIADNITDTPGGGGLKVADGHKIVDIYNSILYGNEQKNLILYNYTDKPHETYVYNSLVGGGPWNICKMGNCDLYWDDSNIDADPLWVGDSNLEEYPYMLQEGSPAINKGTLDIPDFEFPEFDLAGNPRIVNGMIDMGAYEYQGITSAGGEILPNIEVFDYKLYNYPNPISLNENASGTERSMPGTTISFQLPKSSQAIIDIYNVKGQFVKRLINAELSKGEYSIFWNGKDEQERLVGSGLYMYQLSVDDVIVSAGRCTVIK
ncbi:MAG: DUF1565 domain-containing protein, partial [Candidatus Cloacimonas sp.]|nr:DUF1565 domain-containing protein [Candidatus Cloacimonadota bacterium]